LLGHSTGVADDFYFVFAIDCPAHFGFIEIFTFHTDCESAAFIFNG
jgi:hypothetical protein